jgi:hypothetical protein
MDTSKLLEQLLTTIRIRYHIVKRLLHERVGIPMASLYRRFIEWCSTTCVCKDDDSNTAPDTRASQPPCQVELSLIPDSANTPRSPTSVCVESVETPDARGTSVRFHECVSTEEKIQEVERELSSTSLMKISRSNSISSIIRENYVDTNETNETNVANATTSTTSS